MTSAGKFPCTINNLLKVGHASMEGEMGIPSWWPEVEKP